MKKLLIMAVLMGIVATSGQNTMASTGSAYTSYMAEQVNNKKNMLPRQTPSEIKPIGNNPYRDHR